MRKKETDLEVIKERYQKRLDRQNNYNKQKYDHISIILPSGSKEAVLKACSNKGYKNPSEYFRELLKKDGVLLGDDLKQEQKPEYTPKHTNWDIPEEDPDSLPFK